MSVHPVEIYHLPSSIREGIIEEPVYQLSFDGLFRGAKEVAQAGFMCFGWVLYRYDLLVGKGYGVAARGMDATSNIAEYLALIDGLQTLVDMGAWDVPVQVVGDAKVVINQMRGRARITADRVVPMHEQASDLADSLQVTAWRWVPRRQNKAADLLTRRALREFRADRQAYEKAWDQVFADHAARRDELHYLGGMLIFPGGQVDPVPGSPEASRGGWL